MANNSKVEGFVNALRTRIISGEFGDDGRLPSFRTLASEYETTQETMNKTMHALQAEGLLISSGAKGLYVNNNRLRIPGIVPHFIKHVENSGFIPTETTIDVPEIITPPSDIAKEMLLPKNMQVVFRRRLQGTSTFPLRLVEGFYPKSLISDDMFMQICENEHFHIVNSIKKNFGKTIKHVHEDVISRLPTPYEQKYLKVVRTNPVLETKLICYTADKKTVVMYLRMILNANHFLLSYDYQVAHWE